MSQLDYLSLGMGNAVLLHDGDACANVRGYAVQALEECVFSVFTLNTAANFTSTEGQESHFGDTTPTYTVSGGAAATVDQVVDGNTNMLLSSAEAVKIPAGTTVYLPVHTVTLTTGACIIYTRK